MSSSTKNDVESVKSGDEASDSPVGEGHVNSEYDESWDEWYDESVLHNKKSKIRRYKKRLYKNHNEW